MLRRLKRLDPKLLKVRHSGDHGGPVVQRNFAGTFDLLTINLRHIVSSVKLRSLEVVYPNTWNPTEFRAGVAQAFEQVNRVLEEFEIKEKYEEHAHDADFEAFWTRPMCSHCVCSWTRSC